MAKQTLKSSEIEARINELGQQIINQGEKITELQQQRDEAYKAGHLSDETINVVELGRQIEDAQTQLDEFRCELAHLLEDKLGAFSTEYHEVLADKQKEVITLQADLKEAYDLLEAEDTTQQLVEARKTIKQLQSDYNILAGTLEEAENDAAGKQADLDEKQKVLELAVKEKLAVEKERDEYKAKAERYYNWWKEEEEKNAKPFRILQTVITLLDALDDRIHDEDYYTCVSDAAKDDVRSLLITIENLVKGYDVDDKVVLSGKE